jgi:hypothetical protein
MKTVELTVNINTDNLRQETETAFPHGFPSRKILDFENFSRTRGNDGWPRAPRKKALELVSL